MKRLIVAICTLLFTSIWANSGEIKLNKAMYKATYERSMPIIPSVHLNGNTIILSTSIPLENLQVTIKDETDQVISEETIFVSPQQPYTFSIENVEDGSYILELNDGEEEYYGSFEITQ